MEHAHETLQPVKCNTWLKPEGSRIDQLTNVKETKFRATEIVLNATTICLDIN